MIDTVILRGSVALWVLVLLALWPFRLPGEPRRDDPAAPVQTTPDHDDEVTDVR